MTIHIRPAIAADIESLAALESSTYADEGYPAPLFYQALAQWPQWLLIAARDDVIVGYVLAAPGADNSLWVMSLLVAESARGEGVGSKLMKALLTNVGNQPNSFSKIALTVSPNNHGALHLYHQLGFEKIKQINDFMGPGQHRLFMQMKAC
ncbi:GNAT family N-acetyltransferase [Pseudidiomarina tainanensis]|uniref:GNAT family N-acetyltransferase n=1 Tax=Pseudidiomarina tainanensis TaxID=502365 RepID=A0ACD2HKW3_9GAMM|nr:N-acetyltransferase [Pseudidiomarina tainanensis]RZQ57024.1 GNAT family N-acetyltransferase [Pseudidiomarina tainanensis]